MSYLLALHHVGDVLLDKLCVLDGQLVSVIVLLFIWEATNILVKDRNCFFSIFNWFVLCMVLISVYFFVTYLSYPMVVNHKKSSDLVFGNLLFHLHPLLVRCLYSYSYRAIQVIRFYGTYGSLLEQGIC